MHTISRAIGKNVRLANNLRFVTTSSNLTIDGEKIDIPTRIPRSPTDILRALDSTVGHDPTAAHYKYHDDPFLIPMSNIGKRTFAMSQESGRKAAHWVRRQHADLFQHKEAEPFIEAFAPPMIFNETSEVTCADLGKMIDTVQVSDAKLVYNLLKSRGVDIDEELRGRLLELMCFQNSEDGLLEEFIEERWFRQSGKLKEKQRKTWKDGDFAEELFISLENPSSEAYSAIIQGMVKYYQVDRAWQLFEEAYQKRIPLNINTHNSIISVSSYLKENYDLRWTFTTELLQQIKSSGLKPNLGTLNAVLQTLSSMGGSHTVRQHCLSVLSEFKKIGIEPSLGSWYFILITFCKERGTVSTILNDIMIHIENKSHEIRDLRDTHFFVTAMDICRYHLRDMDLAKRVHKLLHFENNYDLIGDSYKESIYYRHYFCLFASYLPIEEFMNDIYGTLVPHIYVPEPGVMLDVLNQVDLNGAVEFIPKLWSDMVVFDHVYRENLIDSVTNIMVANEVEDDLKEKFATIAWDIYNRIGNQPEFRTNQMSFTGDLLGKILILVARSKNFERSCTVMDKLEKDQQNIVGVPKLEALSLYVDECIENKSPTRAINCIQYAADCGFPEANILAARLHEKLNLDSSYLDRLSRIVGDFYPNKQT